MIEGVGLHLEEHLWEFSQQEYGFYFQSLSMPIGITKVQTLTPITPIVLRYGSHFLKEGVMALVDSVITFEM